MPRAAIVLFVATALTLAVTAMDVVPREAAMHVMLAQFDAMAVADDVHRSRGVPPRLTQQVYEGMRSFASATRQTLKDAAVAHRRLFAELQASNTSGSASCDQTAYNKALQTFGQTCQSYKVDALFDFDSYSNASLAQVEAVCANNCTFLVASLLKDHGACMSKELKMQARLVKTLCVRDTQTTERCASTLKLFKFLSCDKMTTKATCESENYQCQWAPTNKCEPRATDEFLSRFCRPCLASFLRWALRIDKNLKFLQAFVQQVWCRKIDGQFCMPLLAYYWADNTTLAFQSNVSTTNTYLTKTCLGVSGRCFRSVAAVFVRVSFETAKDTLRLCVAAADSTASKRVCFNTFNAYLENLQRIRKLFKFMCFKNAGSRYCISEHINLINTPCYLDFANKQVCNTTCSYNLGDTLLSMGCCKELIHDWVYGPLPYFDPRLLPKGAKALAPDRPAEIKHNRTNLTSIRSHIYNYFRFCPTIGETNATIIGDLWDVCPRQNNATANLTLSLRLPWKLMKDDDDLRAKVMEALANDLALAVSATADDMGDGGLSEDTNTTLTVATTTAHGFVVLESSGGVTYTTTSAAESSSDASTQSSTFASQKSSNELVLATTSGVVSGECTNCIGNDDGSLIDGSNDDTTLSADVAGAGTTTTAAPKKGLFSAAASTHSSKIGAVAMMATACVALFM